MFVRDVVEERRRRNNEPVVSDKRYCRYITTYYDIETEEHKFFRCKEQPLESRLCIFHDENYLADENNLIEREKEVSSRFGHKIKNCVENMTPLLCIGYHLPDIRLDNVNFVKPIYFIDCTFLDIYASSVHFNRALFSNSKFYGETNFPYTSFPKADFSHASFYGETNFPYTSFPKADFSQ
jgi:uncharacterized protein YjbI with pentapeptide repeats